MADDSLPWKHTMTWLTTEGDDNNKLGALYELFYQVQSIQKSRGIRYEVRWQVTAQSTLYAVLQL